MERIQKEEEERKKAKIDLEISGRIRTSQKEVLLNDIK